MIVVDIGCHLQEGDESIYRLCDRFAPCILFGFDPDPHLTEGLERYKETWIVRSRMAAWTHNGYAPFDFDTIRSGIVRDADYGAVACFDLSAWLGVLPISEEETVLKLDCEGAEYPLLRELHERGLDASLSLVLVEWHSEEMAHGWFAKQPQLRCPTETWL